MHFYSFYGFVIVIYGIGTAYDLVNVQINNYHKARSRRSMDSSTDTVNTAIADTISLQISDGKGR